MSHLKRRYCHFNASLQKKYPFIRRQKDKEDCFVFCELCSSNISIANGGLSDIRRHIASAKHQQALGGSSSNLGEGKFDPRNCSKKKKIQGAPLNDEITSKEELDYSTAANQQEETDFEAYWFDPETTQETNAADGAGSSSPSYSDHEQKYIPNANHKSSISKSVHGQAIHRNDRTLSVQRMKMFEAELRVWQRKGEAIVKLMETVGHDKEMWEIINKQSRQHEKERDRIREEYDIL